MKETEKKDLALLISLLSDDVREKLPYRIRNMHHVLFPTDDFDVKMANRTFPEKLSDGFFNFFLYSVAGWAVESLYCSLGEGRPINRGFLIGPMCPIYGTGATVYSVALNPIRVRFGTSAASVMLSVLTGIALADTVEYVTSYGMEKLFNARWWDYSNKKYNINGRICLEHSVYWGIAAMFYTYIMQPRVARFFYRKTTRRQRDIATATVGTIFAADFVFSVLGAVNVGKYMRKLSGFADTLSNAAQEIKSGAQKALDPIKDTISEPIYNSLKETAQQLGEVRSVYDALVKKGKDKIEDKKDSFKKNRELIVKYAGVGTRRYLNKYWIKNQFKDRLSKAEGLMNELRDTIASYSK